MAVKITWAEIAQASNGMFDPSITGSLQLSEKYLNDPVALLADLTRYMYKVETTKNELLSLEEQDYRFQSPSIRTPVYNPDDESYSALMSFAFISDIKLVIEQ